MHEGHHGILDGVDEDEHHDHEPENSFCGQSCSGEKAPRENSGSGKNLKKTAGVLGLAILLTLLYRLLFS